MDNYGLCIGTASAAIDPLHLPINRVVPPVHIEQIVADGRIYLPTSGLRLPAQLRDLTIDYTALSLVAPEKVRFRYKLEGQDRDWREVLNIRRVQYSNLAPGSYRFRVTAANNSGVWNQEGALLDFSVAPAYWQTNWFRALCGAAFMALMWTLYRLRLRHVAREFERGLDARVDERTRIARELHDTLLQSFNGLLLRFQTVWDLLPRRPAEAGTYSSGAIDQANKAITEGTAGCGRVAQLDAGVQRLGTRDPLARRRARGGRDRRVFGLLSSGCGRHSAAPAPDCSR